MFARAPVLGKVKTRLIPVLGDQGALDMHLHLVDRQIKVLNTLNNHSICRAQLWVDQNAEDAAFTKFMGEVKLQQGNDLGEKMYHASKEVLEEYSRVVIIGSDCPGIDESYLEQALQALEDEGTHIVLGPALDGGYVLIAMKQPREEIFQDVDWGTERVLEQTLDKCKQCGLSFITLSSLRDIDTAEDLKSLL
jgi:rSAM/selenodomain-associated transferase 1